jgi:1-deoxy-D-xylulose-5-phosphate synthase
VAIRYPRGAGPGAPVKAQPVALEIGVAEVIEDGQDVAILGLGAMLPEAMRLATMLRRVGFSAAVINPRFAKPIDRACVAEYARRCGLLVTLEDHVLAGGFGSAVLEALSELELDVPVVRVGWPDQFIEHGKLEALHQKYGLTAEAAMEKARPYLVAMESRRMALR